MKKIAPSLLLLLFVAGLARADEVRLKSGAVLEGQIVKENAYELQLLVARNKSGTIKTVKIIDQEEIEGLSRTNPKVTITEDATTHTDASLGTPAPPEKKEADRVKSLEATAIRQFERLLQQTDALIQDGDYDKAIQRFQAVASSPKLTQLHTEGTDHALSALELRIRAHKLWMVALEGKSDHMKERQKQLDREVDLMVDQAEDNLKNYEREAKALAKKKEKSGKVISMRSRSKAQVKTPEEEKYEAALERAQQRQRQFQEWAQRNTLEIGNLESQIDLLDEQTDQLEDEHSELKRRMKYRR